jgi:hypothetical protein
MNSFWPPFLCLDTLFWSRCLQTFHKNLGNRPEKWRTIGRTTALTLALALA